VSRLIKGICGASGAVCGIRASQALRDIPRRLFWRCSNAAAEAAPASAVER